MEKTFNYFGDEEGISCEYQILISIFFDEPPAKTKRFANLSKKDWVTYLSKDTHKTPKNLQIGLWLHFEVSNT